MFPVMVARDVVVSGSLDSMLTRFNLGSIPSTAKSTLGLKIKVVRTHQISHVYFFLQFFLVGHEVWLRVI